jgi:purine-nucleoside phosphorylase
LIEESLFKECYDSLILGSGLGPLAGEIEESAIIPYDTIPHFPQSGVAGHAGRLIIGKLQGQTVLAMQGRTHYYEGQTMQTITMPIRAMQVMGINTLIVTNAAGGLNPDFQVGDLMLITDPINLTGLAGHNPLRGPNIDQFGVRFPSMVAPYDLDLQDLARQAAKETGIALREGIYVNVAGPSFETPAECRMLRLMGADAVGMSTAPEVVVANHAGMRVLGFSGVANMAVMQPTRDVETTHEEVLQGIRLLARKLTPLVKAVLAKL